ncbi:unnamed protein product, partial [Ectocarpus sp. 8 AP-2014]
MSSLADTAIGRTRYVHIRLLTTCPERAPRAQGVHGRGLSSQHGPSQGYKTHERILGQRANLVGIKTSLRPDEEGRVCVSTLIARFYVVLPTLLRKGLLVLGKRLQERWRIHVSLLT